MPGGTNAYSYFGIMYGLIEFLGPWTALGNRFVGPVCPVGLTSLPASWLSGTDWSSQ